MAYFPKRDMQKQAEAAAPIWKCTDHVCRGWMRVEFTFEKQPTCPLCGSQMSEEIKVIPQMRQTAQPG